MIPQPVLDAARVLVNREPLEDIPAAVKTLRTHAGFSQPQLAQHLHVQPGCIGNWESGFRIPTAGRIGSIFRACGLYELFDQAVTGENRVKLDRAAYRQQDADSLEYDFFLNTRGQVLERVVSFAQSGNMQAARLYLDWLTRNEQKMVARESTVVSVSEAQQSLRNRAVTTVSAGIKALKESASDPDTHPGT